MQYLLESNTWVERNPSTEECRRTARRTACRGFNAFTREYKINGCRQWGRRPFHFTLHILHGKVPASFSLSAIFFVCSKRSMTRAQYIRMIIFLAKMYVSGKKTNALSFQEYKPCICLNKQAFHNFVWQVCFKQSEVELESNIFKPSLTRVFSCVWDPLYVLVWPSGDFFYYYYYFLCVCVCAIFILFYWQ